MSNAKIVYTTDKKLNNELFEGLFDETCKKEARIERTERVNYLNKIKKRCPTKDAINVRKRRRKMAISTADMKYNYERLIYLLRDGSYTTEKLISEMKRVFNISIGSGAVRSIVYKIKKWTNVPVVSVEGVRGVNDTEYGIPPIMLYDDIIKTYLKNCKSESKDNFKKYKRPSKTDNVVKADNSIRTKIGRIIKDEFEKIGVEISGSVDINVNINFHIR